MFASLNSVIPLFALVLLGFAVRRSAFMMAGGAEGLTGFVFYLAVPALLLRTAAAGIEIDSAGVGFVTAYLTGTLIVFALAGGLARFGLRLGHGEQTVFGMSCVYGNTVLLGIPLIGTLFGSAGLAAVTLIIGLQTLVLLPLTTLVLELGRIQHGEWRRVGLALRSVIMNPIVLSILAGFAISAAGFALPAPAMRGIDMLAAAATPCALVALGSKLAVGPASTEPSTATVTAAVSGIKLIVHPLVVWLLATQVAGLSGDLAAIALLVAALPVGATAYVFAQTQDLVPERAARSVAASTAYSLVTLSILTAVIGPGAGLV